jgi:hypothetical protein
MGAAAIVVGSVAVLTAKEPVATVYLPRYCGLATVCGSQAVSVPVEGLRKRQKVLGWSAIAAGAAVMTLSF